MSAHEDVPTRPVWHWYALAAVLLVVLMGLDLTGVFDAIGPASP